MRWRNGKLSLRLPMHPIGQQMLLANFINSELQQYGMDVEGLLAEPGVRKFVDLGGEQGSGFYRDHDQEAAVADSES